MDIVDIYVVLVGTFIKLYKLDVNAFLPKNTHKKQDLFVSPF